MKPAEKEYRKLYQQYWTNNLRSGIRIFYKFDRWQSGSL